MKNIIVNNMNKPSTTTDGCLSPSTKNLNEGVLVKQTTFPYKRILIKEGETIKSNK